jgi:sodium-dependent dicarboxylate transporter 2/3/5
MRTPLILLFANGYLIYRLFVVTKLTDLFVLRTLRRSEGSFSRVCLYIITAAALLSFFIPNAVTVLILLPILKTVEQNITLQYPECRPATPLTLSAIYGANIGGMGSLIGSPANLLLIGALDVYQVPGREYISFFNWLIWSVPLVILFVGTAWLLLKIIAIPGELKRVKITLENPGNQDNLLPAQQSGLILFAIFIGFWITESVFKEFLPGFGRIEPAVCLCFFVIFLYLIFVKAPGSYGLPLLRLKDIFTGLPKRGILFLVLFAVIVFMVRLLQLDRQASAIFSNAIRPDTPAFVIIFSATVLVIFLTEFLSNTVVSTAFFPIAYFIAADHHISPLILMISVSLASTCAFMTPVATPCNALAFGEMKGTSLSRMLVSGFLLNLSGAFLMSIWLAFMIPLIYP